MPLVVYNTQSRRKEEFIPLEPGVVRVYVCGVTVYDDPHIGHARCYVAFDAMVRHFLAKGWRVDYVRNFTDIDDKIIRRAAESGLGWRELADKYIESFRQDMAALDVLPPSHEPRATEHIAEMIATIQTLMAKGHAYQIAGGDVLFAVESFDGYGKLSRRNLEDMQAGARVEVDPRKKNPMDFVLWKASKPGEPSWDGPLGPGRPGWHIECTAMSGKYLGQTFDIHGGGEDLVFPHHENEIAQSEACTGRPLARYWLHNGFVRVNHEKMSKSLGNFFTIKDILKLTRPEALRLFLLSKHYRSPLDFSDAAIKEAGAGLERLYTALQAAQERAAAGPLDAAGQAQAAEIQALADEFEAGMDDDFNTARAIGALFGLARLGNKLAAEPDGPAKGPLLELCARRLRELGGRLGILRIDPAEFFRGAAGQTASQGGVGAADIEALIAQRNQARKDKNFAEADRIRDQLKAMGVTLQDSPQGTTWRMEG